MKKFLSGNALKIIALVTMTIDHVGCILFPNLAILRIIGRIAFPIYAYFIAEGCKWTKNKLRYFLVIFLLGIFCQIFTLIFVGQTMLNILLTFSFSIGLIYLLQWLKKQIICGNTKQVLWAWVVFFCAILVTFLLTDKFLGILPFDVDYGFWGIMLPVFASICDNSYVKLILFSLGLVLVCVASGSIQWFSLISVLLLLFYNGKRGKHNTKYLFYVYYPLHIAALYLLQFLINIS